MSNVNRIKINDMRQRFEQQMTMGVEPISEVKIRLKSRDEMPPTLIGFANNIHHTGIK